MVAVIAASVPSHNLNQFWINVNWALGKQIRWNLNRIYTISRQEPAHEDAIGNTSAILLRSRCMISVLQCVYGVINSLTPGRFQFNFR